MSPSAQGATLLVGTFAYVALAVHVWTIRRARGAKPLAVLLLSTAAWSLAYSQEFLTTDPHRISLWADLELAASCTIVPTLAAFVFGYTGVAPRLARPVIAVLLVDPIVTVVLLVIPGTHHVVHALAGGPDLLIGADHRDPPETGALHTAHSLYVYTVVIAAVALLVTRIGRASGPFRRPGRTMIVALMLPPAGSLCFAFGMLPDGWPDPAVCLFVLTGIAIVWGFFRLRIVDVIPGAWHAVVERLPDAVLVVDDLGRLLDSNPAAGRLLGPSVGLGSDIRASVPHLAPALDVDVDTGTVVRDIAVPALPVARSSTPTGVAGVLEAQITPITQLGAARAARVLVLRDVTERRATLTRLRAVLREQTQVAQILAQCLQPGALPVVPGLSLASRTLRGDNPDRPGTGTGGAFCDVHRTGDGGWALCLGEVGGHDVRAAALTALARSTLRMFGAQALPPGEVMAGLNRVLMEDPDGARTCATVYVRTDAAGARAPGNSDDPGGAREPADPGGANDHGDLVVHVAVGADTPPLLRHPDGTVETLGDIGGLLGRMPDVTIPVREVRLAPGSVLLMYTAGLVGSRFHSERFGASRLATALRLAPATAAGVADAVLDAVRVFATQTDDIAVLAMAPTPRHAS